MKLQALDLMTNVDKGQLFFSLFPQHIPAMIDHIQHYCQLIIDSEEELEKTWNNGLITLPFWIANAKNVKATCESQVANIRKKSPAYIADQLFYGMLAITTVSALEQMRIEDDRLKAANKLLFG